MDIKLLTREYIPCWYELSWRQKIPAIVLRVHKDLIAAIKLDWQKSPLIRTMKDEFNFNHFTGNFAENFGFDNAFRHADERGEFVEFIVKIPRVKKRTNAECGDCNGSGKKEFVGYRNKCPFCEGTGKERIFDWQPAYAISASFTVFTTLAHFPEIETSSLFPQLLTIRTITRKGDHGGSLGGEYSILLVKWMSLLKAHTQIPEMINAMKIAYNRMLGLRKYDKFNFRASVDYEGGWLNVSCPGQACGLNPVHGAEYDMKHDLGYKFDCHNTDTPMQQITLLAGLAALHDRAREETQKLWGSQFARQLMPEEAKARLEKIAPP